VQVDASHDVNDAGAAYSRSIVVPFIGKPSGSVTAATGRRFIDWQYICRKPTRSATVTPRPGRQPGLTSPKGHSLMIRSHVRSLTGAALIRAGAVAIAAVTASALAACGGNSSDSGASSGSGTASASATKALKIGFSPFSLQPPALKGLADGLTAAGKAQGDTVLTADPKGDPSTQLQQLQQWIQLGRVDAIWVIPTSGQSIAAAIKQAKGIVVIASGVPSDYGLQSG
jgi:hypothetical protein